MYLGLLYTRTNLTFRGTPGSCLQSPCLLTTMSSTAQTNGKKSSNSSAGNTPASTPVTNGNSQSISQSTPPPPNNNAPKYGTLIPNRIFVGGISANTTEGELLQLFSNYGTVKAAKIIQDRAGVSKGYGFITFESEDDAKRPLKDADNIVLRERKLNIAPAIKKQPFNRAFDASSPSTVTPGNTAPYFFSPSTTVPYYQGGVTYYQPPPPAPGDPNSQPTTVYQAPPVYSAQTGPPQAATYPSMMFSPPIYMPQQYPMPPLPYDFNYYPNNGGPQYMVGGQNGSNNGAAGTSQGPPMPPSSSPPRPACYNPQLSYAEQLYYNMPIYGPPIDGAIYAETIEMANGGYPEGPFPLGEPPLELELHEVTEHPPPPAQPTFDHEPSTPTSTNTDPDTTRQSKTPVVSLLSVDHHQEKDFISLQAGRRVKPQPPPPPIVLPPFPQNQPPPPLYQFNFSGPPVRQMTSYKGAMGNGWRKPRTFAPRKPAHAHDSRNDSSSRSSLRTDSNSSANALEEGQSAHVPPMMVHNSFHLYNGGTRTYQNSLTKRNNNKPLNKEQGDNINKSKSNFVQSPQMRNNGQTYALTSTTMRRNKRTPRRNQGPLGEIGAGDAPIPNNDVTETCKKMETLKM